MLDLQFVQGDLFPKGERFFKQIQKLIGISIREPHHGNLCLHSQDLVVGIQTFDNLLIGLPDIHKCQLPESFNILVPFATVSLLQGISFQTEPEIELLNLLFYFTLQINTQIDHLIDQYLTAYVVIGYFIQLQKCKFLMFLIDAGSEDCVDFTILSSITGNPCDTMTLVGSDLPGGVYWLWMGPSEFYDYPCADGDTTYWINIDCPAQLNWLSASPEVETVPGGGTLPITVSWDATDLVDGIYNAALKITHDGRSETMVPCTIEIGDVIPPDTVVLVPDPISSMMENEIDGVDPNGYIYIGDDLGWVNPDLGSFTVNGSLAATGEIIGYYPGLTAPIVKLTFDLSDFAVMYNEGLMWDCETRSYTVEGTDDGGAIATGDDFTYCGHTAGDLNLDGQIDIADLVFMVEFMFADGPAPEVLLTADINADGAVDISDLVAFVDYMFNGGEPPMHQ